MTSRRLAYVVLGAALAAATAGRVVAQEPRVERPRYNSMSDAREVALGRRLAASIERDDQIVLLDDPSVHRYVTGVVARLARASRRPGLPYSIRIVETSEVNAFALPGGRLYVNRGLLEWVTNESELAAVLAHELGHVAGRHASNRLARSVAAEALLRELSEVVLGSESPAHALETFGRPLTYLAEQKYRRSTEFEADLLGYYSMQRAGWNAAGMVTFLRRAGAMSDAGTFFQSFVATHPTPRQRERRLVEEMRTFPPADRLIVDSAPFRAMQARLRGANARPSSRHQSRRRHVTAHDSERLPASQSASTRPRH